MSTDIDNAIREFMGVRGENVETVWIYGQMRRATRPAFDFTASRGMLTKQVTLMVADCKRYRDGDSSLFLIEIPRTVAAVLELGEMILTDAELDRLKRNIDMRATY